MSTEDTGPPAAARDHDRRHPERFAARARSFGSAAADYAEHRPDYPAAALEWVLAPIRQRKVVRVLDLGAGTGALTRGLLALGVNVIAVEPDPAMRDELLARTVGAAALAGSAEAIPLPDNRVDAVLAGQAFHWFNPERALPEIARVLTPGGVLGLLWNYDDDRVPWLARLRDFVGDDPTPARAAALPVPDHPLFTPAERGEFRHLHRRTAASLVDTMATYSVRLVQDEAARAEWRRAALAHLHADPEVPDGEFDVALRTYTIRTRLA